MINIEKQYAQNLLSIAKTDNDWLAAMKFGMPTMIRDTNFLYEMIRARAEFIEGGASDKSSENLQKRIYFYCSQLGLDLKIQITQKPVSR